MPGLSRPDWEKFLDEPGHLLRLGTNGTDGMPRVVPIWFIHEDEALWFTPRARSGWFADLRADPAVCCTIDESDAPMRKVIARGRAELVHDVGHDDRWRDRYRRMACRYTPENFVDAYIADTIEEPRGLYRLDLSEADITTWRMPVRGEDRLAVWGRQYYHDGR